MPMPRADEKPDMRKKAANDGDRLKHTILLESLNLAVHRWPKLAYAETHAGAGRYYARDQPSKKNIKDLETAIRDLRPLNRDARISPRLVYLSSLDKWWTDSKHLGRHLSYPGSFTLARTFLLNSYQHTWEMRATDSDPGTYRTLKASIGNAKNCAVKNFSFLEELDWLTGKDSLFLLVDPFRCSKRDTILCRHCGTLIGIQTNGALTQCPIHQGRINLQVVDAILNRCAKHKRTVVHLWTPADDALRKRLGGHLQRWKSSANAPVKIRAYRTKALRGRHHEFALHFVIGIGQGINAVPAISSKDLDFLESRIRSRSR